MRLADLPSTRVVDGRRQKRRPVGTPPSEAEAYRALLADAQEAYQQALGCVVMLTNAPTLERVKEDGRAYLKSVGATTWARPVGLRPANQRGR